MRVTWPDLLLRPTIPRTSLPLLPRVDDEVEAADDEVAPQPHVAPPVRPVSELGALDAQNELRLGIELQLQRPDGPSLPEAFLHADLLASYTLWRRGAAAERLLGMLESVPSPELIIYRRWQLVEGREQPWTALVQDGGDLPPLDPPAAAWIAEYWQATEGVRGLYEEWWARDG